MPVLMAYGTGGQGIVSERLTHDTLRFRGCRDELSLQRNASRRSVEKDQRGGPCLTCLGGRIMVAVRARERQLAFRRRQSHARPQTRPHYPICPRPRTCPHPCCGITAFDSGGADACHTGLRGCSCWLYCSRSCSSSTLPSADPASVRKSSHGRQPRARGELHTCPGFLGRPQPLPGSTDCGVSHRRRAPGHLQHGARTRARPASN